MSAKCRPVVGSSSRYSVRPVRLLDQLAGQLDPLRLAAGERRRRLADLDVVEADRVQRAELVLDRRDVLEVLERLLHVHLEHLGDALLAIHHLQRLAIEAVAARRPGT